MVRRITLITYCYQEIMIIMKNNKKNYFVKNNNIIFHKLTFLLFEKLKLLIKLLIK